MFKVELYGWVRRAVLVDGLSQRVLAREFGISRKTIRKMLAYAVPPGYQRQQPVKRPKLGPWIGVIDAILEEDKLRPARQRHTAKRVFERLKEEHRFTGGYTVVKDYMRSATLRGREMFVPLTHPPGEAQADFGEALVVIAGVECKAHYLAMDLPHSDDCFVIAFPAETTEAFLEGHVRAFAYFGGVPTRILYDNSKIAVAKILGGTERQRTRTFSELQSHYLFADKFGRPARGKDKGKVEGIVGMHGGTSWFRCRALRAGMRSTRTSKPSAASVASARCAATRRRSPNASSVTVRPFFLCPPRPMRPARRSRHGSPRWLWCAIAAMTTRCPRGMDICRFWSAAMSMR
jgi:transposase